MTNFPPPLPLVPSNSAQPTPSTSTSTSTSPMLEEPPLSSNAQGKKPANRNRDDIPGPRLPLRRAERPSLPPPPLPFYHLPALSMPSPTIRPSSGGHWDPQLPWETVQEEEEERARAQARDWRQWLPGGSFPAAAPLLDQEELFLGGGGEEFRKYLQRYNMSEYYENENGLSSPSLFNTAEEEDPDLYGCCSWMTRNPEEEEELQGVRVGKRGPGGGDVGSVGSVGSAREDNDDEMSIDSNGNAAGPVSSGRKSKGKGKAKREEGDLINWRGRARDTLTTPYPHPNAYPNNPNHNRNHGHNPYSPTLHLRIPFPFSPTEPTEPAESMDWSMGAGFGSDLGTGMGSGMGSGRGREMEMGSNSENTVVEIRLRDDEDLWGILGVLVGRGERF